MTWRCESGAVTIRTGNHNDGSHVQDGVDDDERQALRAEGLDPDDPAVIAAIDLVRWELSLVALAGLTRGSRY
jgi:hypothetical protein